MDKFAAASALRTWPGGPGEMASRIRAFAWATTQLGPASGWPQSLRTVIDLILASSSPMWIGWGRGLTFLYNDSCRRVLGRGHPEALGRPACEAWSEVWPEIGPGVDSALASGRPSHREGVVFLADDGGLPEETYYTLSLSPLADEAGRCAGVLCLAADETERVIAARRMSTLGVLASKLVGSETQEEVMTAAECHLGANRRDLPFHLIYLFCGGEDRRARLAGLSGIPAGHPAAPAFVEPGAPGEIWPAGDLLEHSRPIVVELPELDPLVRSPAGTWDQPPRQAMIVPIRLPQCEPAGFLVAALNPCRHVDLPYTEFLVQAAEQLAAALASVRSRQTLIEKDRIVEQIAKITPVVISLFDVAAERNTYLFGDVAGLYGYPRDEVARMDNPIETRWHPDDLPIYRQSLRRWHSMADGEVDELEYRIRRPDGESRWVSSRVMPFERSEAGEVRQVLRAEIDVTARQRAREALRSSLERIYGYFDLGLIGIVTTSPEKGCIEVNDEICTILGYERRELLHKTWAELTHPDDLEADLANFERVMRGELDGYSMDKRWIRKDGQIVESTISVRSMRLEDGSVDYFVALLQDITARKRAEEALANANAELEHRVGERTAQLTALNEELRNEIAERRRAETESLALKDTLAGELAAMTQLHEFSTRLPASTELWPLLQEILAAVTSIQHAEFGSVQLYNPETGQLELVGEAGFPPERLDPFASVRDDGPACSLALRQRRRVVIEDVETDPGFALHRKTAAACGFRAIQSTPLFSRRGEPLGVLSTNFRRPHRPSEHELRMTDLYAVHAEVMIERKRNETAVLRYQQELQALNARLIEVQEMESKRLARELHDGFSQRLAVLGIELGAMARRTSESIPEVSGRLVDFTAEIGTLMKDIHRISRRLHPAILDDLGLAAAIRNECAAFSEQCGIPAEFDPVHVPRELPTDVSLCLYRVAQECLRNVSKHANATRVRVRLTSEDKGIAMEIADVGDGFDPEAIKGKGGLGLISMEERVRLVNGNIAVRAQFGKGVLVRVWAPLPRNRS